MESKLSNPTFCSPFPFEGKQLQPSIPRLFVFPTPASRGRPNFGSVVSSSPGMKLHLIQSSTKTAVLEKEWIDQSELSTLEGISHALIRQEDTIIFNLLERAQVHYNADTYNHNEFHMDGFDGSLVEFMVKKTENLNARAGRYKTPDEHPFFPEDLPEPMLTPIQYPKALSRREFVAEAKFQEAPDIYEPAIKAQDGAQLLRLLARESVETAIKDKVEG